MYVRIDRQSAVWIGTVWVKRLIYIFLVGIMEGIIIYYKGVHGSTRTA